MTLLLVVLFLALSVAPVSAATLPPAGVIRTTHPQTPTTNTVPMAPVAVKSILGRLGLPEEGLQPIEYDTEQVPDLDVEIRLTDIWYALRAALTSYRIFENQNQWPILVGIALIIAVIGIVWRMVTQPPEI